MYIKIAIHPSELIVIDCKTAKYLKKLKKAIVV